MTWIFKITHMNNDDSSEMNKILLILSCSVLILPINGQNMVKANGKHIVFGSQHVLITHTDEDDVHVPLQDSKREQ